MAEVATGAAIAVVALLTACTNSGPKQSPTSTVVTGTRTVVTTRTVTPTAPVGAANSVAPYPADGKAPAGEVARTCPYIKAGLDSEPTSAPNIASLEGDRVGVVTVLTGFRPVGCRFYFSYAYGKFQHEAVADIQPHTYPTATEARTAMIQTAKAGKNAETEPDFVAGLTGIRYQTRFFGPDGAQDWAFVFAKGTRMIVIHTQQTNASFNAQGIAQAIAGKF